jgi:hypothetical protein
MEDIQEFETLNADTLADFNNLPPRSQRAAMGNIQSDHELWPKNKNGVRVKPKRKSRSKSGNYTNVAKKKAAHSAKKTHKRKATKKRSYSSSGFTKSQKIAFGLGGAALLTWLIIKRP